MSVKRKIERKMREKMAEIQELEYQIREARAYVQAMQDAMKMVPDEGDAGDIENLGEVGVRPGSAVEAAISALKVSEKPLHIMELLKAMGKEATAENRASIGSSLAAYVRRGQIFSRPAPNTYGLLEWGTAVPHPIEPPEDFGLNS